MRFFAFSKPCSRCGQHIERRISARLITEPRSSGVADLHTRSAPWWRINVTPLCGFQRLPIAFVGLLVASRLELQAN
jgi:hypothetical protein